jgi:hypothetical protein
MLQCSATAQHDNSTKELYQQCIRNEAVCAAYLMGVATVQVFLGKAYQDPALDRDFMAPLQVFAICPKREEKVNGPILREKFKCSE